MAYVKQSWVNLPNQTTPLSAERLNHLETQFDEAKEYTDAAIAGGSPGGGGGVVLVSDFVTPQGSDTDVRAGLQAAFDSANGVKTVVFPGGGVYGVSSPVVLPEGTTVSGNGATIAIMEGSGTGFAMTNFSLTDSSTAAYNGNSRIHVDNLVFDGGGGRVNRRVNSLTFNHARDIKVTRCLFSNTRGYHALEMNAVNGFLIDGCVFEGYETVTGLIEKEAVQVDCANQGSIDSGMRDGTMSANGVIRSCIFRASNEFPAHPIGVGSHARSGANFYEGIHVDGCSFSGNLISGVGGFYWKGSTVTNSIFLGSEFAGVRFIGVEDSTVSGCYYNGPGTHAFAVQDSSRGVVVSGNSSTGSREGVAFLSGSTGCIATGNTLYRHSWYGVVVSSGVDCLVSGNSVIGTGFGNTAPPNSAIRLTGTGATRNSVTGNVVRLHGVSGQPEATVGVSIAAAATDSWVFGNDFKGLTTAVSGTANTTSNRV